MTSGRRHLFAFVILLTTLAAMPAARALDIFSPDFAPGQPIPAKYSKEHGNISPALRIKGVPEAARSLVLIVDDPDAPDPKFTHWVVWNIDVHHAAFLEGRPPHGAVQGRNSFGTQGYGGPKPPSGTHRYFFRLYALSTPLELPPTSDRQAVTTAMQGKIVAQAKMFGTYQAR